MRGGALTLAALAAAGCSVIAGGGEPASWPCTAASERDCEEVAPAGQPYRCLIAPGETLGVCAPCDTLDACDNGVDDDCDGRMDEGAPETCNGLDDDCDDVIDDELDEDADTFTWCPSGPPPLDCDDTNPSVHPTRAGEMALREICDGLDNDCDRASADGSGECNAATQDCDVVAQRCVDVNCLTRPSLCAADEFCDAAAVPPTCTPNDMTCLNPAFACAEGLVCNPATATCVTPRPPGSPCSFDAECDTSLCASVQALQLTSTHLGGANGICSRSCCTDAQCSAGERCWAPGTGARACVPESILAMGVHGVPGFPSCAARRDCPSADCEVVRDDAYEVSDRHFTTCQNSYSGLIGCGFDCFLFDGTCIDGTCQRTLCLGPGDCPTGICDGSMECRIPCGTASDCGSGGACIHIRYRSAGAARDDYIAACTSNVTGAGTDAAACTADTECFDATCVDAAGDPDPQPGTPMICADACCSDATCLGGEQCRPVYVHAHWENHCLPRPIFGRTPP